jgi:5-(carboxyamino)imidazole ribonucleotide mutase
MGSSSDLPTLQHAADTLAALHIPHELKIVSAHRTPDLMADYAKSAQSRGLRAIIAGAGGAAHLPGMTAAHTLLPVLAVPVQSAALNGLDSLLSIVQLPAGVPVATFAIGKPGAINAALFAAQLLSHTHPQIHAALAAYRQAATNKVLNESLPQSPSPELKIEN